MSRTDETRALVLRYVHAWQEPADFDEFRACLADDLVFDAGTTTVTGGDALARQARDTASPWKNVTLLASLFTATKPRSFMRGSTGDPGCEPGWPST